MVLRRLRGSQAALSEVDGNFHPLPEEFGEEIERTITRIFAMVGEAISGATHALLTSDREIAKALVRDDEEIDRLADSVTMQTQEMLVDGWGTTAEREELALILRMVPDLERNGDLAEHIARRAARGLGGEISPRSRGLVERMGEVASTIWATTAEAYAERSAEIAITVEDLDDELDDLHVSVTAEIVSGTMAMPVAIELAMVARFYERFGDHAVNLARRLAALIAGGIEPHQSSGE
jgi:phosphate transport system protein